MTQTDGLGISSYADKFTDKLKMTTFHPKKDTFLRFVLSSKAIETISNALALCLRIVIDKKAQFSFIIKHIHSPSFFFSLFQTPLRTSSPFSNKAAQLP